MAEFDPYGVTQAYTHQSVLTLGSEILTKTLDHEEHERQRAIEDAIERTRIAGENAKAIALEKLARKAAKQLKQGLEDLQARCDLTQEESLEKNSKQWADKLEAAVLFEKDYSDRRLAETLEKVKKSSVKLREGAVAAARIEERDVAKLQLEELRKDKEKEREEAITKLKEEHRNELAELESRLNLERDRAVSQAITEAESSALERITKIKIDHDDEISRYKKAVSEEQITTENVRLELEKETHARVLAEDRLMDVKEEFKYFINSLPGHAHGCYNAEYMISK